MYLMAELPMELIYQSYLELISWGGTQVTEDFPYCEVLPTEICTDKYSVARC